MKKIQVRKNRREQTVYLNNETVVLSVNSVDYRIKIDIGGNLVISKFDNNYNEDGDDTITIKPSLLNEIRLK